MTYRKIYSSDLTSYMVGMTSQSMALDKIEAALKEQRDTPATDTLDARQRDKNIETLTALRDKVKQNLDGLNARIADADKKAAADQAQREADKKAAVMEELRRTFTGSDADFERLKDSLYDTYLTNETARKMAAPRSSAYQL